MFRKKDPNVQGECLKMQCGRYKLEMRRKSDHPMSLKEINRRKKSDEGHEGRYSGPTISKLKGKFYLQNFPFNF